MFKNMAAPDSPSRILKAVSHYHQPLRIHPGSALMTGGLQRAELVTAGRGWLEHEGEWVEVTAGHLLWQGPGERTIGRSDFDDPYRCLAVSFQMDEDAPRPVERISTWPDLEAVHAFTAEAVQQFVNDAMPRAVLCEYLYHALVYRAEQSRIHIRTQPIPEPLRRALAEIDAHFGQTLTLPRLAVVAGWSVPHLGETCRLYLHKTPHQLLMARRLRAVREQLVGTDKPIKAIAVECGFSHAAALCQAFRTEFRMTPGKYREEFQTLQRIDASVRHPG